MVVILTRGLPMIRLVHVVAMLAASSLLGGARPGPTARGAEPAVQLLGHLRQARAAATTTAIAGSRLLVAGGMTGGGALASFEIVDGSSGRIVAEGEMLARRVGHTATRLPDGRILIVGGYDGSYLRSAELFDPGSGGVAPTGAMADGRSGHTATLLSDGTVLVIGGIGDGWSFLSSAERYDPRTGRFSPVGSMTVARESHTATLLPDGRVLVTGGHRGRRERIVVYSSTEIYDPARGRFEAGPPLGTARHKHDAVALSDGRVLILGGSDARDRARYASTEIFDPSKGTVTPGPAMASGRYKLRDTSLRLPDGRILVSGGGRRAELFDPRRGDFRPVPGDLGQSYSFASTALLSSGAVAIVGGYDEAMADTDGIWLFRE